MKLVHSGIDGITIAFKCVLPSILVERLRTAKQQALQSREPAVLEGSVPMLVHEYGAKGGFAFVANTGAIGEIWTFRDEPVQCDWNITVKPRALALLARGYSGAITTIVETIRALGIFVVEHSVSRVDFAFDVHADEFEILPAQFVAHARAKREPFFVRTDGQPAGFSSIIQGTSIQSFKIGRMPGRQVEVYLKTAEITGAAKPIWLEAWGIAGNSRVWRVEVRAGKDALRNSWNVRTLSDLEARLRENVIATLHAFRYVAADQTDSNVTRRKLHPIWELLNEHARSAALLDGPGPISVGRAQELSLHQAIAQREQMIAGNAVSLGVLLGLRDEEVIRELPNLVSGIIRKDIREGDSRVLKRISRARKRHIFDGDIDE